MYTTKANIYDYKETVLYCLEASSRSTVWIGNDIKKTKKNLLIKIFYDGLILM